jgi:hypothetical protein
LQRRPPVVRYQTRRNADSFMGYSSPIIPIMHTGLLGPELVIQGWEVLYALPTQVRTRFKSIEEFIFL